MSGTTYPGQFVDSAGVERYTGSIVFTSDTNQPVPSNTATSGSLSATTAWSSGTGKLNPAGKTVTVAIEIVGDATNNVASCAIALSPDDSTYTTIGTPSLAAAVNNTGAITLLTNVSWPGGWYIKLTLTHVTVAASKYW